MKPAAIGAALLLHTATIGAIVHLGSESSAPGQGHAPLEIVLVSEAGSLSQSQVIPNTSHADAPKSPLQAHAPANIPDTPSRTTPAQALGNVTQKPSATSAGLGQIASSDSSASSGLNVKLGVSIPASYAASNRKPAYPLLSVKHEEQGTVLLHILVRTDGSAGEVHVKKTSGHALLDESALEAVQNWRFRPASVNNKAIAEWYQIAIPFKLGQSDH